MQLAAVKWQTVPKFAAKVDANQSEIVAGLRAFGCTVAAAHAVGRGFPDLVVGYRGETFLIEVKDGNKPPSARKLTTAQVEWHAAWRGHVAVVCNLSEALDAVGIIHNL
tara:strand:- start:30435 stop:30761 length:327 start_codon:yes stop_codon:yes gene_type:complete